MYRGVLAPLVTLGPAALVLQVSGHVIGGLSGHGLRVSAVTQTMLVVLVPGAGTDYGLFLLLDTFLVRTLLVPAIVILCGRGNWWPSRLSRAPEAAVPGACRAQA